MKGLVSTIAIRPHFVRGENVLISDREISALLALSRNRCDDDVIQCSAKVMYEVAEHEGYHGVRLLGETHTKADFSLGMRLPDTGELIRVAACVPPGFSIDVYHVLLGTLEFEPPIGSHREFQYEPNAVGSLKKKARSYWSRML